MIFIKRDDFIYYFENKLRIRIILNNNFFYKGFIRKLEDDHLTFDDKKHNELRISYNFIMFIEDLKEGSDDSG